MPYKENSVPFLFLSKFSRKVSQLLICLILSNCENNIKGFQQQSNWTCHVEDNLANLENCNSVRGIIYVPGLTCHTFQNTTMMDGKIMAAAHITWPVIGLEQAMWQNTALWLADKTWLSIKYSEARKILLLILLQFILQVLQQETTFQIQICPLFCYQQNLLF